MKKVCFVAVVGIVCLILISVDNALAGEVVCECRSGCASLYLSSQDNPLPFIEREGRWEGIHYLARPGSVWLTEFTRGDLDLAIKKNPGIPIELSWQSPKKSWLILATSYSNWNYSMCTDNCLVSDNRFNWDTGLMRNLGIEDKGIGLVGYVLTEIRGRERKLYFPVQVGNDLSDYRLRIVPDFWLNVLYLQITPCSDEWVAGKAGPREKIGGRNFPRGYPISLPVKLTPGYKYYHYYLTWIKDSGMRGYNNYWLMIPSS